MSTKLAGKYDPVVMKALLAIFQKLKGRGLILVTLYRESRTEVFA